MKLSASLRSDTVDRLPLREAIEVTPATLVRQAMGLMRNKKLGCVFVVDPNGIPRGMFTEGLLLRILADDPAGLDDPVSRHLCPRFTCIEGSRLIADLLKVMHEKDLRFVGVTDESGRLIGLTGQKGLIEYTAEHYPSQVMVARAGLTGCVHEREGA